MSEPNGQPFGACEAFGCPLPGVKHRGNGWWCFIHHDAGCELQATTERIRARARLLVIVLRCSNMPPSTWVDGGRAWIADAMAKEGRNDLAPSANDERYAWVSQTRSTLRNECFVSMEKAELDGMKQGKADALAGMSRFASYAPDIPMPAEREIA